MTYKIYELIGKSKTVPDGYNMTTIETYKLEEIREWDMENDYDSIDAAYNDILKKKTDLKSKTLTILPIININWGGEVS